MATFLQKIYGTISNLFQIGLGGPQLKNNSGAIESRNAADSAYAVLRGASPVGMNDLVTKQYVDQLSGRYTVTAQFDGNNALPSNTGTEHYYVVTTTGPNASIGQLVFDNGSGTGTATTLTLGDGWWIVPTTSFSGGTISLLGDTFYIWDQPTTAYINAGGTSLAGAIREVRYAIGTAATTDSATVIPANAYVTEAIVEITTPYSGGATIKVGQSGTLSLLADTVDNLPQVAGLYSVPQDTAWGASALAVRTTIAGAPSAGAGVVIVKYTVPTL